MNCQKFRSRIIEHARLKADAGEELAGHLESCAACAGFLQTQRELNDALNAIADESACIEPPLSLESTLLQAIDSHITVSPKPQVLMRPWWMLLSAPMAALGVLIFAVFMHHPAATPHMAVESQTFIEIPYVLPPAPYERTEIMRMDIPVASLIAAGFDVHADDVSGLIRADVLVGQDGRAFAIRFISGKDE